ncbi:hypothetical protein VTN31DRAFT_5442 [Thermomyces dupontii]|uniref:uncharacterized protein n=1 Tax=Talaromyces thermophilus TaxID=28565 RepID=UPI0037438CBA
MNGRRSLNFGPNPCYLLCCSIVRPLSKTFSNGTCLCRGSISACARHFGTGALGAAQSTTPNRRTVSSSQMEVALLDGLLAAKRDGLDTDGENFKGPGWIITVLSVKATTNQPVNRELCENCWRKIKQNWRLWLEHKGKISGWGCDWDDEEETLVAERSVAEAYFREHPEMRGFRDGPPENKKKLEEIMEGVRFADWKTRATRLSMAVEQRTSAADSLGNDALQTDDRPNLNHKRSAMSVASNASSKKGEKEGNNEDKDNNGGKSSLAESIDRLGNQIAGSTLINAQTSDETVSKAMAALMDDLDNIIPDDWKDDGGNVPFDKVAPFYSLMEHPIRARAYLHLPQKFEWLLRNAEGSQQDQD